MSIKIGNRKKLLILVLGILTVIRIIIALKIPLFAQGDAVDDDYLYIAYAKSLIRGQWLGHFGSLTLAKSISYSFFLVLNNWLGLPYQLSLILFYIISISILTYALKKIFKNKFFLGLLYIVLLYSPVMLHQENIQKIYRGGVLVSSFVLVVASLIGLYSNTDSKKQVYWSLLASLALPFFYYVKEDSIWIMPFVLGMTAIGIFKIIHANKKGGEKLKIFISLFPLLSLLLFSIAYKSVNKAYYEEYTITDRSGTYFKNVLHDLLIISEGKSNDPDIWVSKASVKEAEKYSPTLRDYSKEIDLQFVQAHNNKIYGDIFFWDLRNALSNIYGKNGAYVNNFYKKIDYELQKAFKEGRLKRSSRLYISPVAKGISKEDLNWFRGSFPKYLKDMYTYKYNELSVDQATGTESNIRDMSQVTNSVVIWPGTLNTYKVKETKKFVKKIQRNVVNRFKKTGTLFFMIGVFGFIILTFEVAIDIKNKSYKNLSLWLICIGLIISGSALFIGIQWFCRFLSFKKFYDYICCDIIIMQFLEVAGIYVIFNNFKKWKIKITNYGSNFRGRF